MIGQLIFMAASALVGAAGALAWAVPSVCNTVAKHITEKAFAKGHLAGFTRASQAIAAAAQRIHVAGNLRHVEQLMRSGDPSLRGFGERLRAHHWAFGCELGCTADHAAEAIEAEAELRRGLERSVKS